MRLLVRVLVLLAAAAGSLPARAEDPARRAVLILDRGADARQGALLDAGNALRIWRALEARGIDVRLLAAGAREDATTRLVSVPPTRAGLAALGETPSLAFRGPTDARAALAHVLDEGGETPVDLVLIGPWSERLVGAKDPLAGVLERWNEDAPADSRIYAVGDGKGRGVLASARGWLGDGLVVLGTEAPVVQPQPFSPLAHERAAPPPLEASVRVLADVLTMGPPRDAEAVLDASSDVPGDRVEVEVNAGLHVVRLTRPAEDGRVATLTLRPRRAEHVHWLGAAPAPVIVRWNALRPDAVLRGPRDEVAPVFLAVDVPATDPVVREFTILQTNSPSPPRWSVADAGRLPEGLDVALGPRVRVDDELSRTVVRVTFRPSAGRALTAKGVLALTAGGEPRDLELPYDIRVQPGAVALEAQVEPAAVPHAAADALTTIRLVAGNRNAPRSLRLQATCDGEHARWLRGRLLAPDGSSTTWPLDAPLELAVGVTRRLAFELAEDAPADLAWPCRVTLAPEDVPGTLTSGRAVVEVRRRTPRLQMAGPPPVFRVEQGTLVAETPLVLELDADGGDGEWLLGLLATAPRVRPGPDAPTGWQAVARGRGAWHVVPTGRWRGADPGIFQDARLRLPLDVTWDGGEAPGRIEVPVLVPARWGKRGFLFLILAGLALILALTVMTWMRTPAVQGTLLYTVDGLGGTVGRLDLAPVGRRVRAVTSEGQGRLAIAGEGPPVARVRPTRVGGMLEYTDEDGTRERRLLVDGLSLRLGRHLVRFVSGRAAEASNASVPDVPDLLGPEYDLDSGRIDALEGAPPPPDEKS